MSVAVVVPRLPIKGGRERGRRDLAKEEKTERDAGPGGSAYRAADASRDLWAGQAPVLASETSSSFRLDAALKGEVAGLNGGEGL
eukprot:CAMPEP_0117660926 /NCGR_PEP_ID=MMETSP0804-20121206/7250_1 /TAXON_ID=1074897 /ORGANISM="Tetraselmis astigmatica, Strain CCMP880" /LENGTH=84 /DNA_ID=CAMNT_0005467731 /DNA_START=144 /DNA_END=398 /DNA_ORIENTATION=-